MSKETMTITRDLFDEMLQAATYKERNRIIRVIGATITEHLDRGKGYIPLSVLIEAIEESN